MTITIKQITRKQITRKQITIKQIKDVDGCTHFQELQRRVWVGPELDVVPNHVAVTVIKNGGGLLGAYSEDGPSEMGGMVGATFWWPGVVPRTAVEGVKLTLKMCSHMAGVLSAWQGRGIGLQMKLAQRTLVLEQGLTDWITWTYDPLYLANGVFNIHRLGGTCNTYARNVYGDMQDDLNKGVPSDRCQVDWWLRSERVLNCVDGQTERAWATRDLQVLPTSSHALNPHLRQPIDVEMRLDGTPIALPIPDDIGLIRRSDSALSLAWRLYVRRVLEEGFDAGYQMVDCVRLAEHGWHYILAPTA